METLNLYTTKNLKSIMTTNLPQEIFLLPTCIKTVTSWMTSCVGMIALMNVQYCRFFFQLQNSWMFGIQRKIFEFLKLLLEDFINTIIKHTPISLVEEKAPLLTECRLNCYLASGFSTKEFDERKNQKQCNLICWMSKCRFVSIVRKFCFKTTRNHQFQCSMDLF